MVPLFDHRKIFLYISMGIAAVLISSLITSTTTPYGIFLSYLGAVIFVIALTHRWVSSGSYLLLTICSTGIIIISIILNNLLGEYYRDSFLDDIRKFLFFLALFLCPFGIVIGIVGCCIYSGKPGSK